MRSQEIINKFIEYAILSPYFHEKGIGINLLIIARPESGKTYNLKPTRKTKGVMWVQDLTYSSLVMILDIIKENNIKTLVIPDMSKTFSKKLTTIGQLITALNLLVEEGISNIYIGDRYFKRFDKPIICNIIGATTPLSFKNVFRSVGFVEFISRIVPISFQLSENTIEQILDNLDVEIEESIEIPKEYIDIGITKEQKLYLYRVAKDIIPSIYINLPVQKEDMPYGIRLTRSLILMSKIEAWKNGRNSVSDEDIRTVESLAKRWIGLNFEVI